MNRATSLLCLWALAATLQASPASAFIICLEPRLGGYFDALERAERVLPKPTHSASNIAVYIEKNAKGDYYYQSNFIPTGHTNPVKLQGDKELTDVLSAFSFILHPHQESINGLAGVRNSAGNAEIYLDKSVFEDNGQTALDLEGFQRVRVVDKEANSVVPIAEINTLDSPPPVFIETVDGCCLFIPASYRGELFLGALRRRQLSRQDIVFISLVNDSATDIELSRSALANASAFAKGGTVRTESDLARVFASAAKRGKTVILLGHTEGGHYVTRSSDGTKILFEINIQTLREMAQSHAVNLVDFGCDTAHEIKTINGVSPAASVIAKINSVNAVNRISSAIVESDNYADFFARLAAPNLKIVLGRSAVNGNAVNGQLMVRSAHQGGLVTVGAITLGLVGGATLASSNDDATALANQLEPGPASEADDFIKAFEKAINNKASK
jgi:hypothetical protein